MHVVPEQWYPGEQGGSHVAAVGAGGGAAEGGGAAAGEPDLAVISSLAQVVLTWSPVAQT
jgi:hypothetical protein